MSDTEMLPGASGAKKSPLAAGLDILSGYGLTCVILLCLMVLTYFGTYAQKSVGLVRAQQLYFDSFLCEINFEAFGLPGLGIRFPGGFLLLSLLLVNLLCGGIVRIKWSKRTMGILIAHFGIVFLLFAGLVKFARSTNGFVQFWPGETVEAYESFHEWEVVIGERRGTGKVREHLIPDSDLARLAVFHSKDLPFELAVFAYHANARVRPAQDALANDAVDGVILEKAPPNKAAPVNVPGLHVEVRVDGEKPRRGILWGDQIHPWTVEVNGVPWTFDLRKRTFDLPFAVRLEEFRKEEHPGVSTPRLFSSDVTKIEGGMEQKFHIAMNEPMRHGGYMFSQNNWGPEDGPPYYSVLEVSSNPSDQWPKYACYVIAIGLLIHFLRKLMQHVARQNKIRRMA